MLTISFPVVLLLCRWPSDRSGGRKANLGEFPWSSGN